MREKKEGNEKLRGKQDVWEEVNNIRKSKGQRRQLIKNGDGGTDGSR